VIGYDPTESRSGTRLPDAVIQVGTEIQGLEPATGADLIISAVSIPTSIPDPIPVPCKRALEYAARQGAVLVQRKSGGDFLSSIPDLGGILHRMNEWAPMGRWLLVTRLGEAMEDSANRGTGWSPESIAGAILRWKLRGGNVEILPTDDDIPQWISFMHRTIQDIGQKGRIALVTEPMIDWKPVNVTVKRPDEPVEVTVKRPLDWATTGSWTPKGGGWGPKARDRVWQSLYDDKKPTTLLNAIIRVCSGKTKIPGIGPKSTESLQEWVGWDESLLKESTGFIEAGEIPY